MPSGGASNHFELCLRAATKVMRTDSLPEMVQHACLATEQRSGRGSKYGSAHLVHGFADKVGDELVLPLQVGPQLRRGQLRLEQRVGKCRCIPGVREHRLWIVHHSIISGVNKSLDKLSAWI